MGKCYNSPIGIIRGPIGKLIFSYRKGIQMVYLRRDYKLPLEKQPTGFKNDYNLLALLIRIYHLLKPEFYKYFGPHDKSHIYFIGQSLSALYQSIPDNKQLLSENNWADMSQLQLVYQGRLYEPKLKIENLTYISNRLHIKWNTSVWKDGKPDDTAHIIVLYCAPSNKDIQVYDYLYESQPDIPPVILNSILSKGNYELKIFYNKSVREQGETTILINENLNPKFLTAFLFFSNNTTYSDISVRQLLGL